MIKTGTIVPTHNELRNPAVLEKLIKNYPYKSKIKLIITEDGTKYCGDGHHRLVAADYLWGEIGEAFVDISYISYSRFLEVNVDVGWVTPYDPRTHCRITDFYDYKREVISCMQLQQYERASDLIANTKYTEPRRVNFISELTDKYLRS